MRPKKKAERLAARFPADRVREVVAAADFQESRGELGNRGGYIVSALEGGWDVSNEAGRVHEAKARAERTVAAERRVREERQDEAERGRTVQTEQAACDALVASLDDETLEELAQAVYEKYEGNTAVLKILRGKPPRECRLMKMEIAGLLARA